MVNAFYFEIKDLSLSCSIFIHFAEQEQRIKVTKVKAKHFLKKFFILLNTSNIIFRTFVL